MKNLIYLILFTGIVVRAQAQNKFQRKYLVRDSIYYSMLKSAGINNGSFLTLTSYNNLGATAPQLHVMNCFPNGTTNWYKTRLRRIHGFTTDFTLHSNNQIGVSGVYNFSDPVYILLDSSGNICLQLNIHSVPMHHLMGYSPMALITMWWWVICHNQQRNYSETDPLRNVHRADEYEINNHPVVFNIGLLL